MRLAAAVLVLALAGCEDLPGEEESIAYEGPAEIAPSDEKIVKAETRTIDGRYGASAADCDADNRYMTEYLEIADGSLTYRGEGIAITDRSEDTLRLRGGEQLAVEKDRIVRWPGDARRQTAYTRCD